MASLSFVLIRNLEQSGFVSIFGNMLTKPDPRTFTSIQYSFKFSISEFVMWECEKIKKIQIKIVEFALFGPS